MPRVLVAIAEGTEELEAIGVVDILRRGKIDVTIASVSLTKTVECSKGCVITADASIKEVYHNVFDAIVLPGGIPGANNLRDCTFLTSMLKKQKESGKIFAAICAAPAVVFSTHGLIDDRIVTCYPSYKESIKYFKNEKVVVDKNCITSQGPGTVIEFGLQLVESLCGKETRNKVANGLLFN